MSGGKPVTTNMLPPIAPASVALHPRTLVPIDHIELGMVLAEPVHDRDGRLLATVGTPLTLRHQRQMRQRGITMVAVAVSQPERATSTLATSLETTAAAVEMVAHAQRDPFMRELLRVARERHERRHTSIHSQKGW
jgi:hypothetical protein